MTQILLDQTFEDPKAVWEELLLRDSRFRERVAQARDSVREGSGLSIAELREKYAIRSQGSGDTD